MRRLFVATLMFSAVGTVAPVSAAPVSDTRAQLVEPMATASEIRAGRLVWRCEGDTCVGERSGGPGLDSLMRDCRAAAVALGPLKSFSRRGRIVEGRAMRTCNSASKRVAQGSPVSPP